MHFQDIISTLNRFWSEQGCLLLQPYDTEKGAGTMSPHTVLRAIGPEPWAVAYPEPCRRPTDGPRPLVFAADHGYQLGEMNLWLSTLLPALQPGRSGRGTASCL